MNKIKSVKFRGKKVRPFKKIRLGEAGIFLFNAFGQHMENNLPQFVLKAENKGLYDAVDGDDDRYNYHYDLYIKGDTIKKDFAFIEYIPNADFNECKIPFEEAYKQALAIAENPDYNRGRTINVFIYDNYCFLLSRKFLNVNSRHAFRTIENEVLSRKYKNGARKSAKNGAVRASYMTDGIIRAMKSE